MRHEAGGVEIVVKGIGVAMSWQSQAINYVKEQYFAEVGHS